MLSAGHSDHAGFLADNPHLDLDSTVVAMSTACPSARLLSQRAP